MSAQPAGSGIALAAAVRTLAADAVAAEVVPLLQRAGVPVVLLKGASHRLWLYGPGERREYGDTDLLVPVTAEPLALQVLAGAGFVNVKGGVPESELPPDHAHTLVRTTGAGVSSTVDLHTTLPQALRRRSLAWEVLSEDAEEVVLGGTRVPVLRPAARALVVALHAAHDGMGSPGPLRDLERAVGRVPDEVWAEAALLAARLDVLPVFAHGLRLTPAGAGLSERLIGDLASPFALRLPPPATSPIAHGVRRLLATTGARGRGALVLHELIPSPAFLRWWWAQRSGTSRPLWFLYAARLVHLLIAGSSYGRQLAAMALGDRRRRSRPS